ncbi:uncharacterized protein LOC132561155 [Ylistrum balloti]|uniref:uncharacterized protein LOC132561155 n=1 Tax=Ylistrum balloti TaxID=509963 RepID=UPI00290596F2|nr:uncharacterized protein LOC132561155 [Ylistrum balloti]
MPTNRKSIRLRRFSSSSGEESGPSRRKILHIQSPKKKKRLKTLLDSDSDDENNGNTGMSQMGSRSSERISKRNSRSFQMPSRESVWSHIPTTPQSSNKAIGRLKPRKVFDRLNRVTHRYNQDVYDSEDEESGLDDFLVSDEEEITSSEVEGVESVGSIDRKRNQQKKQRAHKYTTRHHRIKGYHSKLLGPASSSSESENEQNGASVEYSEGVAGLLKGDEGCNRPDVQDPCVKYNNMLNYQHNHPEETMCEASTIQDDPEDKEGELKARSHQGKRRYSRIASSSDSNQSTTEPAITKGTQFCTGSEVKNQNDSEKPETVGTTATTAGGTDSCNVENSPDKGSRSNSGTNSDSDHQSDSSCESVSTSATNGDSYSDSKSDSGHQLDNIKSSRARHQIEKQESVKKKRFEAFLEARRKLTSAKRN